MQLKTKFLFFLSGLFFVLMLGVYLYSQNITLRINEEWGKKFMQKQIVFDKYRTLLPIMREVNLTKELSREPAIYQMALNEDNPKIKAEGLEVLERYRNEFHDRSYFVAFRKSQNYYFNDSENKYKGNQLRYKLSDSKKDDRWFFEALKLNDEYQINVNKDTILGTSKVWINFLLKDKNNKTIAVIGTGLDLTKFLKESVDINQEGIRNIFINKKLAIQLERDTKLIDYGSLTKESNERKTLNLILKNPIDIFKIKLAMNQILASNDDDHIRTLWLEIRGKKEMVGIAYLRELGWFSISMIDAKELSLLDNYTIFTYLIAIFLVILILINTVINVFFFTPISKLRKIMKEIEKGNYNINTGRIGTGEIADLSLQFSSMVEEISNYNSELENKVKERTFNLKESEQKLNTILENIGASVYIKDLDFKYLYVNRKVCEMFGKPEEEIINKDDSSFFDEEAYHIIRSNDEKVINKGIEIREEEIIKTKDGDITMAFSVIKVPLKRDDGTIYAICGISTDITDKKIADEKIRKLAFYDSLTGLANRRLLDERLIQTMKESKRSGEYCALLFMDLDHFKPLNDQFGHHAGDKLLIEASERILSTVREVDTVARFGGDEFIVLLSGLGNREDMARNHANLIGEKIRFNLEKKYIIKLVVDSLTQTIEHNCTVSVGISLFLGTQYSPEIIMKWADLAMYASKEKGRNRITIYPDVLDSPE
ncbi:MAG: diguanylate cyclase [Leptospiraceae bacterium]|nr:diguanylate cyclase [Leptospiraceae bacterium]MCP5513523.1 diguanylate cyclase [Leptospiraceae bacterium]